MSNDHDLLLAYRRGSEAAFGKFYDRHRQTLYVYLVSFVRRREPAEELLQETFLTLLTRADRVELRDDMTGFLITVGRRLAIDWLRRERRGHAALKERSADAFFREPTLDDDGVGDTEELSRLLHELPDDQREVVVLKELVGLTFREIGELADCPENTAVSRYRYGLKKLRARWVAEKRNESDFPEAGLSS